MTKVGIVGAGRVGAACALAIVTRGSAREVVIVDRTRARAKAVATDLRYGAPLCAEVTLRDGDYSDLEGAGVVLVTAGVNEKSGGATDRSDPEGRLKLLDANAGVYTDMVPRIVKAAPEAVLLVVTDPPDPLADLTRRLAGHDRVLSTGTLLDTLRFRVHLAQRFEVSPASVEAQVVGEHGTSEVLLWSTARVAGVSIAEALPAGTGIAEFRESVERDVRYAEIRFVADEMERLRVRDLRPEQVTRTASRGVAVRVLGDKTWGFACTATLDEESVVGAVERALAIARASSSLATRPVAFPPRPASRGSYASPVAIDPCQRSSTFGSVSGSWTLFQPQPSICSGPVPV